ncbi:MAG: hypothetical protein ABFD07_11505 [Methanobacterium sp.]
MDEIARVLGISTICFYKWKEKYPDFYNAVEHGKEEANGEVTASLFKKCKGYYFYEKIYEPEQNKIFNKDGTLKKKSVKAKKAKGRPPKAKWVCIRKIKKYQHPDQRSIEFWQTNRDKTNWKLMTQIDGTMKMDYVVVPPVIPGQEKGEKK